MDPQFPALLVVVLLAVQAGQPSKSPFVGTWTSNLAKSKQHPDDRFKNQTLEISVSGDTFTIRDTRVNAKGQEERRTNIFQTDGLEHPHPLGQGFLLVAQIHGRTIETVAKKDGQIFGRADYEASSDGKTLTLRAYDAGGAALLSIVLDRK
jgi:hypothetical protein